MSILHVVSIRENAKLTKIVLKFIMYILSSFDTTKEHPAVIPVPRNDKMFDTQLSKSVASSQARLEAARTVGSQNKLLTRGVSRRKALRGHRATVDSLRIQRIPNVSLFSTNSATAQRALRVSLLSKGKQSERTTKRHTKANQFSCCSK